MHYFTYLYRLDGCLPAVNTSAVRRVLYVIVAGLPVWFSAAAWAQEPRIEQRYALPSESFRQDDVPRGTIETRVHGESSIYPGTIRRYYIYIPAQYVSQEDTNEQPAALMVFQDGHAYISEDGDFRVPIVLDNMIHAGELPVTLAVFVDPGHKKDRLPEQSGWRPTPENRSMEYDSLDNRYARFLDEEILPAVADDYRFTEDPTRRIICGISSGGICAFTVAWERPDLFRNVISHVGSFVNIRGGHAYPALIRKQEKRPLRVFMQDGSNDLDNQHGNWPLGNKQMYAALQYRNYPVRFVYGDGGHNGNHGGATLPDAFRWIWRVEEE